MASLRSVSSPLPRRRTVHGNCALENLFAGLDRDRAVMVERDLPIRISHEQSGEEANVSRNALSPDDMRSAIWLGLRPKNARYNLAITPQWERMGSGRPLSMKTWRVLLFVALYVALLVLIAVVKLAMR